MQVAIDASRAAGRRRTGTEGYAYQLIAHLAPLLTAAGHAVTLYYNAPPDEPMAAGVEQRIIPLPRLWTHLRLALALQRQRPDIFFTPAHVIPFSYRRASVATVHDLGYLHFPDAHPPRQRAYLDWSTRHNARQARLVVADSEATRADLVARYRIDPTKISVVYPGRDPELQPVADGPKRRRILARYAIDTPYLLFLSTLQPRKNVQRLITAFCQVADRLPHNLILAGQQGWLAQPIVQLLDDLPPQLRSRVQLTGFVDERDKAALLSAATALLYPSLYEGFGFPILEAQSCATAVLTADNSSLPEVAGSAAHFVAADDTEAIAAGMLSLVDDTAYRHALVERGRQNVLRFSWERSARQLAAVLQRAVQQ